MSEISTMETTETLGTRSDEELTELAAQVEIEQEKRTCLRGIHTSLNVLARQYNTAGGDMAQFVMLAQQAATNSGMEEGDAP